MDSRIRRARRVMGAMSALVVAAVLGAGCSTTYTARKATPSGFLGDYSQLKKGEGTLLMYIKPGTDLARYRKIILEPIQLYASEAGKGMARLSREDRQRMVNCLDAVLRKRLSAEHTLVQQAGPDVIRMRVAITEVKGARVLMDTVSTVLPFGLAISEAKNLATGSHTSVGAAGIECEGLDSQSRQRLFATVDERVGRKVTGRFDKFEKFRTAEDAFDSWADWIAKQLMSPPR